MDDIVFLFDVDNTLIDNDRVQHDLKTHLAETYGAATRDRYWDLRGAVHRPGLRRLSRRARALPPRGPVRTAPAQVGELADRLSFRRAALSRRAGGGPPRAPVGP